MQPRREGGEGKSPRKGPKFNIYWIYAIIGIVLLSMQFFDFRSKPQTISFQEFQRNYLESHDVAKLVVVNKSDVEVYIKQDRLNDPKYKDVAKGSLGNLNPGPHYHFTIGSVESFKQDLDKAQQDFSADQIVPVTYDNRPDWFGPILQLVLPILLVLGLWVLLMRKMGGGTGSGGGPGGIFNIGKSKAQLFEKGARVNITFNDVAGLDEAKVEVMEVVDFLKNPKKYTMLGGKIPKGCLLVGPPGTGKTLLAKAMAGEAQVPFFSMSGSDFVELFVGVGASRVRDLFKTAREKAPCIIFIDEIDAIGRARGKNMMMSNDERENTLNQLLVEMDGFGTDSGIIILAATNRPDVLDSALLRPGRFDRQITIEKPDLAGRAKIFEVHLKPIKKSPDLDISKLAAMTPGFAGADIANVCNEAALIAARNGKSQVEMQDFNDAIDRVIGGLEKKNKIISPGEKEVIAHHEAGHAICGWFLEHANPLVKVTIVPRGVAALGYAQYLPREQYLYNTEQLMDDICMTLGGRASEELIFGKISTGAQNDLQVITKMAYAMVSVYGMNEKVGNVSFYDPQNDYTFNKPYSEETAQLIDEEVRKLIVTAYERTKELLARKMEQLKLLAGELLKKEVLYQSDLERLLGKRPYDEERKEPSIVFTPTDNNVQPQDIILPKTPENNAGERNQDL
ncbi:ATP-dependent zinc metalloprotease FtsH [Compostibacter hankyongensis]|uniref:ATP-dependent zinc metalloprotease FtsH n=2 Tax=Compostibacter hankyongensis TaxID=1007089 RepID=A0ABP8FSQ7_9BACT